MLSLLRLLRKKKNTGRLIARGLSYAKGGLYTEAIKVYNQAIRQNPDDVNAYNNRGSAYERAGDYHQAIADYDKAIELKPRDAEIYYNRGIAHGKADQPEHAIADFTKAIELNPKFADAYFNRAYIYDVLLQNPQRAIEDYTQAIKLKSKFTEAYHSRGVVYLGLEDYQVRKFSAMQKVACAVFVAYTQIILMKNDAIFKPLNRRIETIGEGCRYIRLLAIKGVSWLKNKAKNSIKLIEILNKYVLVKNAKV